MKTDLDVNAAMNLKKMAVFSLVGSSPVTACGEKGSGLCFGISETGLGEAGIQQHKTPMNIFGYV
jgi:hypothetical protein